MAICYTNQCNLHCLHCGAISPDNPDRNAELTTPFFLGICKQGKELGTRQINVTGGEVFVRPDCFEMIEGALDLGLFVSIESNGTLLDQSSVDQLASYGDQIRLSVSLDGFSPEVNDAIRGTGSFDLTMSALGRISKRGIPSRIISVLHTGNLDEIPAMARFVADDLGMGFRLIPSIMEYGRGVYACHQVGASWDQIRQVLDGFFYDFLRERADDRHSVELNVALVPIDIEYHHVCPWGTSMIGVGPNGQASLCHVGITDPRFTVGNLTEESLENIWLNNQTLQAFRNMDPDSLNGVCGNCLARGLCRGGCRVHALSKYDDFFAPSPQCQTVYNLGKFPGYALDDPEKDCSYAKGH